MDTDQLTNLGFVITAGMVDRENKNYGFLSKDGPVLTPAGHDLVALLTAPVPVRRGRKPNAIDADDGQLT